MSGWSKLVAGLLAVAVVAPAQAQVAVVSVKSVEALRSDAHYLAKQLDQEKTFTALLDFVVGSKLPSTLEPTEPLGAYFNWPRDVSKLETLRVPYVVLVPVRDEKGFLSALGKRKAVPPGEDSGVHRVASPFGGDCFVRFANGYAYVAAKPDDLGGKLPEPAKILRAGQKTLLVASLYTERLPKDYGTLIETLVKPLVHGWEIALGPHLGGPKAPGESEAQFQQRQAFKKGLKSIPAAAKEFASMAVTQVRELTVNLDVDAKRDQLAVDVAVVPHAATQLADFAKYAARARSRFAYLARDVDFSLLVNFPPPERKTGAAPDELPLAMRDLLGNPRYSELVVKAMQIVVPTIANDGLDACLVMSGPGSGKLSAAGKKDEATVVAGVKVQHGKKFDHLLRDSSNLFPTEAFGLTIGWNHAKHANARIHKFSFDFDAEDDFYLAIREDVIFFSQGNHGLTALKRALDGFGPLPASTPLAQLEVSAAWLNLGNAPKPAKLDGAIKALRATLTGGQELRLRVELNTHLLKEAVSFMRLLIGDLDF